jgi:fatty-acyl-CoA synthase
MTASAMDWLATRARLSPDSVAISLVGAGSSVLGKPAVTFAEWNVRSARLAAQLVVHFGVKKGDRIAVLARNRIEYLDLLFACNKLGCVLQALNHRLSASELRAIVDRRPPSLLFFDEPARPLAEALQLGSSALGLDDPSADVWSYHPRLEGEAEQLLASVVARSPEDAWVICYTGGSTGTPKGAVISYRQVFQNALATAVSWQLSNKSVALLNAPLFHVGGLFVFTTPLVLVGGTSILCDGFDPGQVLSLASERSFNQLFGVPTMFFDMMQHAGFDACSFEGVERLIVGGAPCPQPIRAAFLRKNVLLRTGYGLTEAGPNNFSVTEIAARSQPDSVGAAVLGVEVSLRDEQGEPVQQGQVGELWIRGEHLFSGYDGEPEATSAMLSQDAAGTWLKTGDLATCDADGQHRIVGRKKEMFISGGENVFPIEVETALLGHPLVSEAAVLGVSDVRWGEVGTAVLVKKGTCKQPSDEELVAFCRTQLAAYKVPKRFVWVFALPRTGAGKVDKPTLRQAL